MAQKGSIHQRYRLIEVVMTDGSRVMMKSTYKEDVLYLHEDKFTHQAWTKEIGFGNKNVGQVTKFHERFGDLGFKRESRVEETRVEEG
jgi:ribosomal protein L31